MSKEEEIKEEQKQDEQAEQEESPYDDMDLDLIEKANQAAVRVEKANKRLEYNIAKLEKVQVEKILGGTTSTNMEPPEESPEEYAQKVLSNEV